MNRVNTLVLVFILSLFSIELAFGEGTKQILLSDVGHGKLSIMPGFSEFGWYTSTGVSSAPEFRLNIHIQNPGEKIYYGLGQPLDNTDNQVTDVVYRIKDPLGNIVVGPTAVPLSGTGFISTFNQAIAGPAAIAGAAGYPQFTYTPLLTGDYFIEFNFKITGAGSHDRTKFKYFDITVASPSNLPLDGRVWSNAWQVTADANGLSYPFNGTFYIYSTDSIVTSVYGNGVCPYVFTISCNQYGVYNTGNFVNDRRSVAGNIIIPQYKIFLNNPDSLIYPSGYLGQIILPINIIPNCDGTANIQVQVTKPGNSEIFLDINPLPGIQPEDRTIITNVIAGINNIVWDGLDGLGNPVPNGYVFNITVTYLNGLTNLPIYDIDDHPNGYMINLHRPSGPVPKVYWDDILIGGTQNLTGCTYTLPTTGCHVVAYAQGNNNTVNTWWFASTHTAAPVTFMEYRSPNITSIAGPTPTCINVSGLMYHCSTDPNSTSYIWSYSGTGVTINGNGNDTVYLDFSGTATAGILSVSGFNANCGAGPAKTMNILVSPVPDLTNNPLFQTQCSGIGTNITLTSSVPGTLFTWTCTPSSAAVTGWSNNAVPTVTLNQTLVNSGFNIETVTYHITPEVGGCYGSIYDFVVTVYPIPNVSNSPLAKSQCNNQSTGINLTSNVAGTLFTWTCIPSSANIAGYASNFVPASSINQTLVNSAFGIETVTYRITPTANGCTGPFTDYVVTVYPTPNLTNIPLAKSQCNNLATGITLTSSVAGTNFTWTCLPSSANITGWSNNAVGTTTLNQTLVNTGFNTETVTYQITPRANGCNGPVTNYIVTVYPTPDLSNTPLSKSQCNNTATGITLTSNVAATSFTWTCTPSSGNITGWANNAIPTTLLNQTLVNSGNLTENVIYRITPSSNGCTGPVTNYTVSVYPTPKVTNAPSSQNQCNNTNTAINLTSNLAGATFTWTCTPSSANVSGFSAGSGTSINQTLVNSGSANETVTYIITPTANGCTGPVMNYVVTVYPSPVVTNSPLSQSQCSGLGTSIALTSNVAGATFTWTCTPSSASVTGFSAGSGSMINQTLTNSGLNIETVTYHVTAIAGGCSGSIADYVVTVFPVPNVTNTPLSQSQCNNLPTGINLTSGVAGTLFTWTCIPSSANIAGYASNFVPASTINQTLVNSAFGIETVTYRITPTANGCTGPFTNYVVTVYPTPNLSNLPLVKSQCNNLATGITLTSSVAGTNFTWTCLPSSASITGWSNNAVGATTLNQTLVNTGFNTETVTYQITPRANGCNGPVTNYVVTVFPTPNLSNSPLGKSQCNNTATGITLTSNVTGTSFTWTCTPSSPAITGWANNAIPTTILNQTLVNSSPISQTVTYHITPSANGCTGPVTDYVVTVVQTPDVSNTPLSKQQCNNTNTSIILTSSVPGTTFSWTCTPSSANITGYSAGAGPAINQTLVNTGSAIETVRYTITPTLGACTGTPVNYLVTVYPTPDLSNTPLSQSQCSNVNTAITLTSNVAGTLFTWTATGSSPFVTGYSDNAVPTSSINQVLINTGAVAETVTYHITPNANGCNGPVFDYVVTVLTVPALTNSPLSHSQCNNNQTNITLTSNLPGTLFTWTATGSSASVTGYADNAVPTTLLDQLLVNSGFNTETVTYHITPNAPGCMGVVTDFVVIVYPTPDLTNMPLSQAQCSNVNTGLTLTSNVAGTLFTWTATGSGAGVTGYSDNAVPASGISQTLVNSGFNIETVTYHITPHANGCDGIVYNYTVTVYPTPDLTNTPLNRQQCNNMATNLTLTSNVSGVTFTWTCTPSSANVTGFNPGTGLLINDLLTNTGSTAETVTYHITPGANGCNGIIYNYVVTVYPAPDLTNSPLNKNQCNNMATNLALTSNVSGATFTWTCTPSSGNVTGFSPGSGLSINQTLVNTGFNIETVIYHITPSANGCNGMVFNYTVTVYPSPDLSNIPLNKQQCNNLTTNISLTSNVSGATFTWTATPSSANLTGYGPGSGALINDLLVNTGFNVESVTYHITPSANGCSGIVYNYVVTVFPSPDLSLTPLSKSQCNNQNTNILLVSNLAGTLFTWTATGSSANVTGFADNAIPSNLISQILINTGFNPETVTYHITPAANGCNGSVYNYVVTVYPTPDLSNTPLNKQECNNMATNITLTSNVSGVNFTWTCTPSSPNVTGFGPGSGLFINNTLVNTGVGIETVTYHITPHANGCDGIVYDFIVTVYPSPDLSNTPLNKQQCNNMATNLTLTSNVSGTSFSWTCTPSSANVTGFSPGTGVLINDILMNSGLGVESVTYHITPNANGCNGTTYDYIITVNPSPDLTNTPLNKQQCNNMATNLVLTSSVSGTLFSWTCTPSSANITGYGSGTGSFINQTLVNNGYSVESVVYHITPSANGCNGIVYNYTVTVYPTPDLTTTPLNSQQCSNMATNISLTSNVSGVTYTWTCNASSGNITGFSAGTGPIISQFLINTGSGIETVTYSITPHANGCTGNIYNYLVTVYPTPKLLNSPLAKSQCNNLPTNIALLSNIAGTTFSWTCTPSSVNITGFTPGSGLLINQVLINSGFSPETVVYHIVPSANGCNGISTDYTVTVNPVANVILTPPAQSMCSGGTTSFAITSGVAGATFSWTVTPGAGRIAGFSNGSGAMISQTLTLFGFSTDSLTYNVTSSANGCTGSLNHAIARVMPTTPTTFTLCNDPVTTTNAAPITLRGGIPLGGVYSGAGVSGGIFDPAAAGAGNHVITYTYTNSQTCSTSATQTLSVLAATPFTCGTTLTDVRDSKVYSTVLVGGQCWMADNLNYGNAINSTIPQRDNCIIEKYCYAESNINCNTQGGFYQWDEVMHYADIANGQGICPPGWHIPDETEWTALFNQFGPRANAIAGRELTVGGTSTFDAFFYGFSNMNRGFNHYNFATMFWTSTSHGPYKAWAHGMNDPDDGVSSYPGFRNNAFHVRCVR